MMAKKKFFNKKQKIDWRFVALLIGILLVGLSVFALNQRLTYKSSAYSGCGTTYEQCKEECKSQPRGGWGSVADDSDSGSGWHNLCVNDCRREKERCQQQDPPNWQQQQQQPNQPQAPLTQTGARIQTTGTAGICTRFVNLDTCNTNCGNNTWCQQICTFLATICPAN